MPIMRRSRAPRKLHQNPAAIRQAMVERGLTITELALRVGCSAGHMSEIVNGTRSARAGRGKKRGRLLPRIARQLRVPVRQLLCLTHSCPHCGWQFDTPADGLVPEHDITWPPRDRCPTSGQPVVQQDAA